MTALGRSPPVFTGTKRGVLSHTLRRRRAARYTANRLPPWRTDLGLSLPKPDITARQAAPCVRGFGKSDTPQDRHYTLQAHVENLASLINALELQEITFIMQDWGGPIGIQFTVRYAERVKRLFLVNTFAGYGAAGRRDLPRLQDSRWFRWIGEGLETGRTEAVLRHLGSTVLSVMKIPGFENSSAVNDTWIRAYSESFATAEECIGAIEFPLDAYHQRIRAYVLAGATGVVALKQKPAMLTEGMRDGAIPPELATGDFRALWPNAPVVCLSNAGHYCQEDAPETLVALVEQFIQSNP